MRHAMMGNVIILSVLLAIGLLALVVLPVFGDSGAQQPTPNQQTVEAAVRERLTQTAQAALDMNFEATVNAALGATLTAMPPDFAAQSADVMPTSVPLEDINLAAQSARAGVTRNADWTPQYQTLDSVTMALVPAGSFTIGSTDEDVALLFADCESVLGAGNCQWEWFAREAPPAEVTFYNPFWIDQSEVTNAAYQACVDAGACTPPSDIRYYADPAYADYPVVYVSWLQANEYAAWRGGRVPTEAEWEYAARGPDGLTYPWGADFDAARLNFCDTTCPRESRAYDVDDGYPQLAPAGAYPNGVSWAGAVDMAGNVAEWTMTMYHESAYRYPYTEEDGRSVFDNGRNEARIVRGGSWESVPRDTRTASRSAIPFPLNGTGAIGFRVVIDIG